VSFRPVGANGKKRAAITISVIGAVTAAVSAGLLLSACGRPSAGAPPGSDQSAAVARSVPVPKASQAAQRHQAAAAPVAGSGQAAGSTVLATVLRDAPVYARPGLLAAGTASAGRGTTDTVPATWYERPSVLPVIATRPGWVEVRLARRPNGSTAWLPSSDVTLGRTPYRIVINTATTQLALYDGSQLVFSAPAGVGTTSDPTPTGDFFVAFDEQPPQPNPGYGPFIMVTSAHSPAISDWDGSGDAVIGIHGPLGDDSEIGTTGARISHGCVRLHDQDLEKLAAVPPGTPVEVVG
jgi:lipoprotein-anchoring transpeptidase ErfK/SrfK